MLAERFINSSIPNIHLYDSVETTRMWMSLLNVHHLPIVDHGKFVGIINFLSLDNFDTGTVATVMTTMPPTNDLWIFDSQHIFDALKFAHEHQLTIVPVLSSDYQYLGSITQQDLIRAMAEVMNVEETGDIVVLEMNPQQYSLREIASIVESNYTRLLNVYTSTLTEDGTIYVNLKISNNQISRVIADLERHGYRIAYVFSDPTLVSDSKDHYDALMSFLSI
jgi:CBS domain-containing protein